MKMMRRFIAFASIALLVACVDSRPTGVAEGRQASYTKNTQDLDGLPDLIVDSKATQQNWVTRVEDFPADFCSVQEGDINPGTHTVIRFTVTTPNIGDADVFIGDPRSHIDPNGDNDFSDSDGLFEFATCHRHFHFRHYALYELIDPNTGHVWKAAKRGFCMLDTDPYNVNNGDGTWSYRNCGNLDFPGYQGISDGWADTYVFKLGGQFFVLDGGDGQPVVPPGVYTIRVTVNPGFTQQQGEPCPVLDSSTGICHNFAESNYANNVGTATVIITDHPGRAGYGPLKNSGNITASDEIDHKGK